MNDKPLHDWTEKELIRKERSYPLGDGYGDELRAELARRGARRRERYLLASVIVAAISAFGSMIASVASLIALYIR